MFLAGALICCWVADLTFICTGRLSESSSTLLVVVSRVELVFQAPKIQCIILNGSSGPLVSQIATLLVDAGVCFAFSQI